MTVIPHKFQDMILQSPKNVNLSEPIKLEIKKAKTEAIKTVNLLGINMDDKLNFEEHISELCKQVCQVTDVLSL